MCVLTFVPQPSGYILSNNRDEAVVRQPALFPQKYNVGGSNLYFPKDPVGGGTWIATNGQLSVCLLNGAAQKHIPKPPYRHSRGLVVTDFFEFSSTVDFVKNYNFENLEPFTLIVIDDQVATPTIHQIRWDHESVDHQKFDFNQPRIWSSSTLYSSEIVQLREQDFGLYLNENKPVTASKMLYFHHNGGGDDIKNSLKMNRDDELKTLVITQLIKTKEAIKLIYEDLVAEEVYAMDAN